MFYFYSHPEVANLDTLELSIQGSSFVDAYMYLRWDEANSGSELTVVLNRELNIEEKSSLDNAVSLYT